MAVREVVGAHSGTMEVDSVLGQGTTFTLWFPVGGSDVNNAMLTSAVYVFSQFWTLQSNLSLQIAPDQGHCFVG